MAHTDPKKEQKDAYRWFFVVFTGAVAFVLFLLTVDFRLTYSDREERLGERLRELRTAQTTLSSGTMDPRMDRAPDSQESTEKAEASHEEAHH